MDALTAWFLDFLISWLINCLIDWLIDWLSRHQQELPRGPAGEADDAVPSAVRQPLPLHRGGDTTVADKQVGDVIIKAASY